MVSRRDLLRTSVAGVGVATAGCVGGVFGCASHRAAVVETRPVSEATARSDSDPLVVADLPDEERRIARRAIEEGEYRVCPAADPVIPDPLRLFADRVAARTNDRGTGVYLAHDGRFYAVGVAIEDQSYASLPVERSTVDASG
jgi:hypothetical protein